MTDEITSLEGTQPVADQPATTQTELASWKDKWLDRSIVWMLGAVGLLCTAGYIILPAFGKTVPEQLGSLGLAGLSALAGAMSLGKK